MKKLSKKEFISLFQLVIVILCLTCFVILTISQRFPEDLRVFKARCAYFNTASICLIFALGTWFYGSSVHRTRIQLRVFAAFVMWALFIVIFRYGQIGDTYAYKTIKKYEATIWDEEQNIFLNAINILCYVVIILMFFMNALMTSMVAISLATLWTGRQRR